MHDTFCGMNHIRRRPLVPEDWHRNGRNGTPLIRAVAAFLAGKVDGLDPWDFLQRRWPGDRDSELILKTATEPATTSSSGWADTLAMTAVADFILGMGAASAGSALLRRGLQLSFGGAAAIQVPGVLAAAGNTSFVGESVAIPVRKFSLDGPILWPKKFATISSFSRETFLHSKPTIEVLVRAVLTESVGLALDAALFATTAGDATTPAGLRYNIAGLTASTATPPSDALVADVRALIAAVADVAANGPVILIASPGQAVSLKLRMGNDAAYEVFSSNALTTGVVIAVAVNALASAVDPGPRFEVSDQGTLVNPLTCAVGIEASVLKSYPPLGAATNTSTSGAATAT